MSDQINRAIVLYLGYGSDSFPHSKPEAVLAHYGEIGGRKPLERMDRVFHELDSVRPQTSESLVVATERATSRMRAAYPELNDEALSALGWGYPFGWK